MLETIKNRRSVHHFIPHKKISKSDIEKLIKITSFSPSGYNAQPWEFLVIQDKKRMKDIQKIAVRKILLFQENPYHPSLKTHKLKGILFGFSSFSINEKYRVLLRFLPNNEVIYYDIDTHDIYR